MTILAFIFWVVITFFALGVVTPFKGKQSKKKQGSFLCGKRWRQITLVIHGKTKKKRKF